MSTFKRQLRARPVQGHGPQPRFPLVPAGHEAGLVIPEQDFFDALESSEVQHTLARADEIRRSDAFPPIDLTEGSA